MNSKQIVKNKILFAKISEYFTKNPKKESVTLKATLGEGQTVHWRAVKEGRNKFRISEVQVTSGTYIFEVNNASAAKSATKATARTPKAKVKPKEKTATGEKAKVIKVTLPAD